MLMMHNSSFLQHNHHFRNQSTGYNIDVNLEDYPLSQWSTQMVISWLKDQGHDKKVCFFNFIPVNLGLNYRFTKSLKRTRLLEHSSAKTLQRPTLFDWDLHLACPLLSTIKLRNFWNEWNPSTHTMSYWVRHVHIINQVADLPMLLQFLHRQQTWATHRVHSCLFHQPIIACLSLTTMDPLEMCWTIIRAAHSQRLSLLQGFQNKFQYLLNTIANSLSLPPVKTIYWVVRKVHQQHQI